MSAAAEATADTREPAELELPQVNPAALHAALVDLEHYLRWSARARYGNVLQGWAGRSAGATADASDDQVRGLLLRLGMDQGIGTQNEEGVAVDGMLALTLALVATDKPELRDGILDVMREGPRDPADDSDPDWTRGVAVERRLIALASSRSPAQRRAAAVLVTMAKRCPPDTLADDVARVVATVHATPDARRAWERAELAAVGKTGKAGRPQVNRNVPPLRLIAGTALVAEALAVWSQQKDNEHG